LLRIRTGLLVRATEYLRSHQLRALLQAEFGRAFERVDALLAPTMAIIAPEIGRTFEPCGPLGVVPRAIGSRLTAPCNLTGMPAISIPCGFSDGLPVGLQIMGPAFSEALILRIARGYEAATPWAAMRPPVDP
ncbi:MAG TPA: amidase family protein, partial [Reyranella sp.]|nr:amidase family protein [Reyranella sp.]